MSKAKGSKERRTLRKMFKNKGVFKVNIKAKTEGEEFQVSKRTGLNRKLDEYQPRIYCYGYFLKKDLRRHSEKCNFSVFKGNEKKKKTAYSQISCTFRKILWENETQRWCLHGCEARQTTETVYHKFVRKGSVRLIEKLLLKARVIQTIQNKHGWN